MTTILILIHVIVSIALIMIVLLQTGKGADMGAAFGGGASQTLFGASGASTFLTKATTIAAIVFMVTCLGLAYVSSHRTSKSVMSNVKAPDVEETSKEKSTDSKTADPEQKEKQPDTESKTASGEATDKKAVTVQEQPAAVQQPSAPKDTKSETTQNSKPDAKSDSQPTNPADKKNN